MNKWISGFLLLAAANVGQAKVEVGSIDVNSGPKAVVSYLDFYNDSDTQATCVIYSDASGMLLADGVVPVRKPKFFKLTKSELRGVWKQVRTAAKALGTPKEFEGFGAIPTTDGPSLAGLYYGDKQLRKGSDMVQLPLESELQKTVRALCGFGDDL